MVMAAFLRGKPIVQDYLPSSSFSAGDVIVIGNIPAVAHEDNPPFGTAVIKDALAVSGGIYQIPADALYANGTQVWWDTVLQQVTTTVGPNAYHFGPIVAGPNDRMDDGGPTGSGSLASVLHAPLGANPPLSTGQQASFRNLLRGGDFTTNPAQRGTSQAADITNTTTYGPDGFAFKGGAGSAIDWSINADTGVAGFSKSLKWQRKSANADLTALNMAQALETINSVRAQGQPVTISFWAKKGGNYSGGVLTVQVESGTGTDQSTANLIAGTWTGQAHVLNKTQALTAAYVRYQFTGTVPAAGTQLGVLFQWTPTGAAGADDSISFEGIQLEIGAGATPFERRGAAEELILCQRYFFQVNEPAASVVLGTGQCTTTSLATIAMELPVQMRATPTLSITKGTLGVTVAAGTNQALTTLAASAAASTPNTIGLLATASAANLIAGNATLLIGNAGTGLVSASAEL